MELQQLRYFVAVAEDLHFRRAAARLYVAQPAVSEQIRKLEAELGVSLFDRRHRRVALTEAGAALLEQARRVLQRAAVARLAACNARDRKMLQLRIGYLPESLPSRVPYALGQLSGSSPRIEVTFETGHAPALIQAVRDGWIDAAVVDLPAPTNGLRAMSLGHQRMVLALPITDRRALESEVALERLQPQRLLVLPRAANPPFFDAVVAHCREAGLSPALVEVTEPRVEAILLDVAATGTPALLPESVSERYGAPGVRLVEVAGAGPAFESALLTRPDTENLATRALLHALTPVSERSIPALRVAA